MCWFGTATASFVGFHALGVPLPFVDAICIEAMLHAIMALAFFIPGRVGIQEAAYTLLGGIFGIPPDIALSLSLLRRARDFVIAVPVLLVWQGVEAKRLKAVIPVILERSFLCPSLVQSPSKTTPMTLLRSAF